MADSEEYEGQNDCKEIAVSHYSETTDKQPLLEADRILSGQPLQVAVPKEQPQQRPMYISPEIHPSAKSVLTPESHPVPRQPSWPQTMPPPAQNQAQYGYLAQQQTNTVVVTQQPSIVTSGQNVPKWIGSDVLIYWSVISLLFCGILPGILALALAWEARTKKESGQFEMARSWSVAAIVCNILTMLLGLGTSIGVGVYYGIQLSKYRYYPYGTQQETKWTFKTARSWSVAAIVCNILAMLIGLGASIGVSAYYGFINF